MSGHYISGASWTYQRIKRFLPRSVRLHLTLSRMSEMNEIPFIYTILQNRLKARVMVDVGSSFGSSFFTFATDGWHVFAFEPDPSKWQALDALAEKLSSLHVEHLAVTDQSGLEVQFFVSSENPGLSTLKPFTNRHKVSHKVNTITLMDSLAALNVKEVTFLKTDTEGFDLMVLKGFPWNHIRPRIILSEFCDNRTKPLGYTFHDMAAFLIDQRYTVWVSEWSEVVNYSEPLVWRGFHSYPYQLLDPDGGGNLIAFLDQQDVDLACRVASKFEARFKRA